MRTEDQDSTLGFPIFADDSTAIGTGKTGLTITATLAKNGGSANAVSPTITELENGIYWVTPIAAHRDTIGCNVWQFSASGAVIAPVFERIRLAPATIARVDTAETNVLAIKAKTDTMPDQSLVIISDGTNGREVKVTAAKHIAADVHTLQQEALAQFATDDTGETSAGDGSVALLSQGGGSGAGTVNVLPASGVVADRAATTTLKPVVGETISQSITVYQSDGTTAYDLSGKTLIVVFETLSGADVAVVAASDITIGGTDDNVVTFAYPAAVTASVRTLSFAIRDAAAPKTMYLQGVCSVVNAPSVDA